MRHVAHNLADARLRLERLSRQVGDTAPLQLAFGTLHLRGGDLKAAETAFKRALALDPKSSAAYSGLGLSAGLRTISRPLMRT